MKTKLFFLALIAIAMLQSCGSGSSYQEKVQTIEEMERSEPLSFLGISGKFEENFWGDEINIEAEVSNSATVASYKDIVVRVSYYTKTNTLLGSEDFTVYEVFKPNTIKKVALNVTKYKNVKALNLEIISAIPY